ncbi:AraC family transcriptional regulator [Streptomyces sp. RS10V-4]|uniref:AraC family transcriptional regulator n=1 Tax=Streptomyces rhizoryzae TaxID=2932493 RepID=UPI002002CDE4|nr:AraC family transcriptional regulator [Streptomyces rhizoryzae]MCK7621635.1 AraC family transcriptional regulator [Streptomyces rhizoryzae]
MRPLVRNAALNGYVELARSLGAEPLQLLRTAGLHPADLAVHPKWISADAVAELLELSAAATGREDFGLRLAEGRPFSNLGPVSLAAREEPDVRCALEMVTRYLHLHNEAIHIRISETNGLATIKVSTVLGAPTGCRQSIQLIIGVLLRNLRSLANHGWEPVTVCFTHDAPADLSTHHRVLGPSIRFGEAFDGVVIYASDLDAPNALSDPLLRPYTRQYLETIAFPRPTADVDRIRDLIEALLPTGRCSLHQVAHSLGIDRKTVHRHLARSGETFTSLLNATRRQLAQQYVSSRRRPLTEVAELLGFSASSAFSRWFRTEFGSSPRTWRSAHRHGGTGKPMSTP